MTLGPRVVAAAWILAVVYTAVVLLVTLWPFEFAEPTGVRTRRLAAPRWEVPDGMVFEGTGMFSFRRKSPEIKHEVARARSFFLYLEAWPGNDKQHGPSRMLVYSLSVSYQAFLVGQSGRDLVVRLADPEQDPSIWSGHVYDFPDVLAPKRWRRILITCTPDSLVAYVDGRRVGGYRDPAFAPERWVPGYVVAGNSPLLDRDWQGRIRRVLIGAGAPPPSLLSASTLPAASAGEATILFDLSGPDDRRPEGWAPHRELVTGERVPVPVRLRPFSEPANRAWARADWTQNALLLVPLGVCLAVAGQSLAASAALLALLSGAVEIAQIFLPVRYSQTTDLVLNVAGGVLAWLLARIVLHAATRGRGAIA